MSIEDPTLGELGRRFDAHAKVVTDSINGVKQDVKELDEKVDRMADFQAVQASHGARLDGHDRELRDIKKERVQADVAQHSRVTAKTAVIATGAAVVSSIASLVAAHIIR